MNMWKRIELHNHTVESDGSMTVTELIQDVTEQKTIPLNLSRMLSDPRQVVWKSMSGRDRMEI